MDQGQLEQQGQEEFIAVEPNQLVPADPADPVQPAETQPGQG